MIDGAFIDEHRELTRRFFLGLGVAGTLVSTSGLSLAQTQPSLMSEASPTTPASPAKPPAKPDKAGARGEPYFTPSTHFRDVSRGKPVPHTLDDDRKREVGLTPETWQLEIDSDPDHPAKLGKTFTKANGNAFDFSALMRLAETRSVRFAKVMTCLNLGCPLGMGLWEGVPLRDVVWLTQPRENVRRIHYHGFHNDEPAQMFRSSLPIGRVLEDPFDLPPVILCYKLNGEWLDSERGGPVRVVVPEAYGFKSIKWLKRLVLTNLAHANDTYAEQNNDVDSPLKTFAATLSLPETVKPGEPVAVSGYAQVGIAGLKKVQVFVEPKEAPRPADDPYFLTAAWSDATLLGPPERWDTLPEGRLPADTHGFDANGRPRAWPMRLTNAHWAARLPGLPAGDYVLRSRTIDERNEAQPMPRPFRKSGHAAIETVGFKVVG